MTALDRHAVSVSGPDDGAPLVFVHGFGCDQSMWHPVVSRFPDRRSVLLDLVGFGDSDVGALDPAKYSQLQGHADDIIEVCEELLLDGPVFIGHSVAAMIGVLVARSAPDLLSGLVLVGPSPRYIDTGEYRGGFTREAIDQLLETLDDDFEAWSRAMAPVIAGNPDRPEFGRQLTEAFCRSDPEAARLFARVTFLSDNRDDLAKVGVPTLIMQCADDPIAPEMVGAYVHDHIPRSELVHLAATGHCPHLTAPDETAEVIRRFVS